MSVLKTSSSVTMPSADRLSPSRRRRHGLETLLDGREGGEEGEASAINESEHEKSQIGNMVFDDDAKALWDYPAS